ncbi:hypothetical protein GGR88_001348 [Sphingomonas jejuensis]|uniref:Terminase small subunit n=1 Tax=Sphingomonas jejuensis TaxID=904715 RepID=A0ABX0XKY5_9SPHN|nr:terminase small subunit [Sphingomonas jejuensis]NJC33874.1 hypothetical protein [Sphingomonas jejuensis]
MAASARELLPPTSVRLRPGDLPYWNAVIAERAKSEWTDADLHVAASLARAMADAEMISAFAVGRNGRVSVAKVIGSIAASDKLARRIVTLRRALGIDSRSKHGEQRDVNNRREAAQEIESGVNAYSGDDDDLLARPSTIQ